MRIVSVRERRQYAPRNRFNLVEEGEGEDRKSVLIQSWPERCCLDGDKMDFFFFTSNPDVKQLIVSQFIARE